VSLRRIRRRRLGSTIRIETGPSLPSVVSGRHLLERVGSDPGYRVGRTVRLPNLSV